MQNLVKNGPVVSEKNKFQYSYGNDLDLECSHINLISCLHLPTFKSQAAMVSEKSTVFTFSYRNAQVSKFDLAVK